MSLGVVFVDIGTGPIYAFRESLKAAGSLSQEATVLGVLSMVFWAVVLVVAVKYVTFVMRADNQGKGRVLIPSSFMNPTGGVIGGESLPRTTAPQRSHQPENQYAKIRPDPQR